MTNKQSNFTKVIDIVAKFNHMYFIMFTPIWEYFNF